MHGSDSAKGPKGIRNQQVSTWTFFVNISRYGKDQRLIFGQLAVFDLPESTTCSDHDLGAHRNQKIGKNGLVHNPFFAHRIT